ncbi:MAG TPA: 3'-5' exoribonuclease, partial [Novosphingobium sp.]|nr:3'-5' exoribonuclease [Novosphingobium sp.]
MEEDIENKLGAILTVVNAEEVTEGLDVLTSLLEDENLQGLVTITPPLPTPLDLENLPDDITLSVDFGTGFTTEDGNVFRGGITINISIIRSTTGLRLEVEALFNNVTVNDSTEPYLNGRMTGFIDITQDGQGNMSVAGNISFENVRVNQKTISGSISLSSTNITLNLTNPSGTITVTFSDFVMGEERISGVITLALGAGETPGTYVVSVRCGGAMEPDTVLWWLQQEEAARRELWKEDRADSATALQQFTAWMTERAPADGVRVWGNGAAFD